MIVMSVSQKELSTETSNAFVSPKRKRPTQEMLDNIPAFNLALPTTTTSMETKVNQNCDKYLETPLPSWKNKTLFSSESLKSCSEQTTSRSTSKSIDFLSPSLRQPSTYNGNTTTSTLTPKRHRNVCDTKTTIDFQVSNTQNPFTPAHFPKGTTEKQGKEVATNLKKDEVNVPASPLYSPFRFNSFPDSLPRINPRSVRPLFASGMKNDTDIVGPEAFNRILFSSTGDISEVSQSKVDDIIKENKTPDERKICKFSIGLSSSSFQPSTKKKTFVRKGTTINSFKSFVEGSTPVNSFQKFDVSVPYSQSWTSPHRGAADISHDTSISSISAISPNSINEGVTIPQKLSIPRSLPLGEKENDYLHEPNTEDKWNRKVPVQYAKHSEIDSPPLTAEKVKGTRLNFNSLLSPGPKLAVSEEEPRIHQSKLDNLIPSPIQLSSSNFDDSHKQGNTCMDIVGLALSPCSPICNEDDGSCAYSLESSPSFVLDVEFPSVGSDASGQDSTFCRDNNFSALSSSRLSISPSNKSRKLRPMPDISAFDGATSRLSRRSSMSINDDIQSSSPTRRFVCPPTPWRHRCSPKLTRQDSLSAPKVLATCPPQILDCLNSFETSIDANLNVSTASSLGKVPLHGELVSSSDSISIQDRNKPLLEGLFNKPEDVNQNIDLHATNFIKPIEPKHLPIESVSFNNFENLGQIGQGSFADVYKVRCNADNCLYAVKRNRRQFRGKRDRDLTLVEVHTMQRLQSDMKLCPYLLLFVRAWQEDGYFFCQTELCCRDSCRNMLLSLRSNWTVSSKRYPNLLENLSPNGSADPSCRLTPESTVWKIFHDVVAGLLHIHSHGLVHFDIKPSNIFFVAHSKLGCICKIGDFGMAGDIGSSEDGQEGDTKYMPQEVLSTAVKHPSSDIFSLGLTIYELSSDVLWELPSDGPRWHEVRDGKHSLDLPSSRSTELFTSIQMMTHPDKLKRPSADQILNDFSKIKEAGRVHNVFLADYVRDVHDLEFERERREASFRRSTPTGSVNMNNGERSWNVRTPTPDSSNIHFFPVQNSK